MTDHGCILSEATPDDLSAMRTLYAAALVPLPPLAHQRWKWFEGPTHYRAIAVLARAGESVVGSYIALPAPFRVGDEVVLAVQTVDAMVHPEWRRRGLFAALTDACFEAVRRRGAALCYTFPNPQSYRLDVGQHGWRHVYDAPRWVRWLRPSRRRPMSPGVAALADGAARLLPRGGVREARLELRLVTPRDDALSSLLGHEPRDGQSGVARDLAWLGHRYAATAGLNYQWISAYRDKRLVAAGLWGMTGAEWLEAANPDAAIGELIGGDRGALRAILALIIGRAAKAGAARLEVLSSAPHHHAILRRAAFYKSRSRPLLVRGLDRGAAAQALEGVANWRVMGGDFDGY